MYYLKIIVAVLLITILLISINKLIMNLFSKQKLSYTSSFRIMWAGWFLMNSTVTVGVILILLHIATWLGIIGGGILVLGIITNPNKRLSKDVKHSLELARERRK